MRELIRGLGLMIIAYALTSIVVGGTDSALWAVAGGLVLIASAMMKDGGNNV